MQAKEAMFRNSACQVVPELALNKLRNPPGALPLPAQKCFQLLGDDLIQHRRFRIARPVRRVDSHEGVADASRNAIPGLNCSATCASDDRKIPLRKRLCGRGCRVFADFCPLWAQG